MATQDKDGSTTKATDTPEAGEPESASEPATNSTNEPTSPTETHSDAETGSTEAGALMGRAADAARNLDAPAPAGIVRELQAAQEKLSSGATACRSAVTGLTVTTPTPN